jgi:hypothetical protein
MEFILKKQGNLRLRNTFRCLFSSSLKYQGAALSGASVGLYCPVYGRKGAGGVTIKNRELPRISDNLPLMVNDKTASKILGVSVSYLRKSRSTGAVGHRTPPPKFVKVDGRRLYRVADLKAWAEGLEGRS